MLLKAYELGVRVFNTSDLYGPYTNEELVGKALKGLPDARIATKWGVMITVGDGQCVGGWYPGNNPQ